jgi:hypothetical protein
MTSLLSRRAVLSGGAALAATGPALAAFDPMEIAYLQARMRVISAAPQFMGTKVGSGECTDFVARVLDVCHCSHKNYVWGRPAYRIEPGIIIQFWDTHYTSPDGRSTWGTAPGGQHTAIVLSGADGFFKLIHQNDGVRKVTTRDVHLEWKHTGRIEIFQPL